ncbi:hypothetical protein JHD46_03075 [Sulfurimonas sp. SAG-AH-194-C20]|nr:hypothetical protein [Sulfurimonas sp. SAG-AH-194-C20]MDF1878617.1 hypothetical protein [Sulfurimonas sp. SAG-AH-194-C20]
MGGFEGGDEGGFWDEDAIEQLIKKQESLKNHTNKPKKISIEIKGSAYFLSSDSSLSIVPTSCANFSIEGCDDIPQESNSIYKMYKALLSLTCDSDIEEFFYEHKVVVKCYSPTSSADSFLLLTKELCNLVLSERELQSIQEDAL